VGVGVYARVYSTTFCSSYIKEAKEEAEVMPLLDTIVAMKAKVVCMVLQNESTPPPSK
jgi:hypothetical protein